MAAASRAGPRTRIVFWTVFGLFGLVNLVNALTKGGDFDILVEAGRRLLEHRPLYEHSLPGAGVTWPPFMAVFFAPVAWLSDLSGPLAKIVWHVMGLLLLLAGVKAWSGALDLAPPGATWQTPAVLLPLAAIALPAQTNFEHQNVNPLMLALVGFSAVSCTRGRPIAGGLWLGAATALKAFPALLILYLAIRRQWRTALVAAATAVALSFVPALSYGWHGLFDAVADWIRISRSGWPVRVQNQSLFAMLFRFAPDVSAWLTPIVIAAVMVVLGWVAVRRATWSARTLGIDFALALSAAVLCSPIAWDHYWVLMYPALAVVYHAGGHADHAVMRPAFWTSAAAISALSRMTLGQRGFGVVRWWSNSTLAGLLLLVAQVRIALVNRGQK